MAEAGNPVALSATVRAEPIQVAQAFGQTLMSGGNYLEDTQVVPVGPTTFRITRKYLPQWAIIAGIIGLFLCFIGIFAVFFRDTEVLTIDIQPDPEGSRISVSGVAKGSVVTTIQSVMARFEGYVPTTLGMQHDASGASTLPPPPPPAPTAPSDESGADQPPSNA